MKIAYKILALSMVFQMAAFYNVNADETEKIESGIEKSISEETIENSDNTGLNAFLKSDRKTERISGKDRIETALKISEFANEKSRKVIVADSRNYPDALSASNLTEGKYPILLFNGNEERVVNEIKRLNAEEVIVLGGKNSVPESFIEHCREINSIESVERISGKNRYETSAKIFDFAEKKSAVIVSGNNYPDALAASSILGNSGLILVDKNQVPVYAENILKNATDKNGIIVGGYGSISADIEGKLKNSCGFNSLTRISGKDRYDTSTKIAERKKSDTIIVASGESFADALSAAEIAQKIDSPILLVKKNVIDSSVMKYIKSEGIKKAIILGGESSVSKNTENNIVKLINGENIAENNIGNEVFKPRNIDENIKKRIYGKSYKDNRNIKLSDLSYVPVAYRDFNGNTAYGEIIVNKNVGKEVGKIFKEIYDANIKIEKIKLIDEYNADDVKSMEDNNTSAFNYRVIKGTNKLSNHAMGYAIDINPLYNPHVINGVANPRKGQPYARRVRKNPYMIFKNDKIYNIFKKYGWRWGGEWKYPDYQHFEKIR